MTDVARVVVRTVNHVQEGHADLPDPDRCCQVDVVTDDGRRFTTTACDRTWYELVALPASGGQVRWQTAVVLGPGVLDLHLAAGRSACLVAERRN